MPHVAGLATAIEQAVDAACGARLRDEGYSTFDGTTFTKSDVFSGHGREADPLVSDLAQFARVEIYYPSGATDCHHGPGCDLVGWAQGLFSEVRRAVEEAFERFTDMPDPDLVLAPVEAMGAATMGLAVGGVTTVGGGGSVDEGNPDLASYVEGVTQALGGMSSVTIDELMTSYINRLDWVLNGQHVLGSVALYAIAGEAEIWSRARTDIVAIARASQAAFSARALAGPDTSGAAATGLTLTVVGAAVAVGSLATGPGAIVAGLVGAGLTIAGTLLTAVPAPPPPPPMGGGSFEEILGNLYETLGSLGSGIANEEFALADMMRDASRDAVDEIDQFDLGTPGDFLAVNNPADAARGPGGDVIALDFDQLRQAAARMGALATMTEAIGEDLASSWRGDPGAWRRPGGLGMGTVGHHGPTSSLVLLTTSLVARSSRSMDEIATQLLLIASDFQAAEAQVEAEMRNLIDLLSDPTPQTDVAYGYDERV